MNQKMTLDRQTTNATIEAAIRTQAQIVIESARIGTGTINGYLISGDERALLMEVTGKPPQNPLSLVDTDCDVQLYSDQRYHFASRIVAAPTWGEARSLALARPSVLARIDRRRFFRAKLAPSSKVTLEWNGSVDHRHLGSMLNISPDGLACRLDQAATIGLNTGDRLTVKFTLPEITREFELAATVSNKTEGSRGHVIIGVQFARDARHADQLDALRGVLFENAPAQGVSEVLV